MIEEETIQTSNPRNKDSCLCSFYALLSIGEASALIINSVKRNRKAASCSQTPETWFERWPRRVMSSWSTYLWWEWSTLSRGTTAEVRNERGNWDTTLHSGVKINTVWNHGALSFISFFSNSSLSPRLPLLFLSVKPVSMHLCLWMTGYESASISGTTAAAAAQCWDNSRVACGILQNVLTTSSLDHMLLPPQSNSLPDSFTVCQRALICHIVNFKICSWKEKLGNDRWVCCWMSVCACQT